MTDGNFILDLFSSVSSYLLTYSLLPLFPSQPCRDASSLAEIQSQKKRTLSPLICSNNFNKSKRILTIFDTENGRLILPLNAFYFAICVKPENHLRFFHWQPSTKAEAGAP